MATIPFDPSGDRDRTLRLEIRRMLDEAVDDEMLLKALERRVVIHAINGGAEASLRRYVGTYLVPLFVIGGAIAAFFGWRFERSLDQTMEAVERNKSAIEKRVEESNSLIETGKANASAFALLQREAASDVNRLNEASGAFQKQLGVIETQQASISARKVEIDQTSSALAEKQRDLAGHITEANAKVQSAIKSQEMVESIVQQAELAVQRALSAARDAEETAAAAQAKLAETQQNIVASSASATAADEAAQPAIEGAASVDSVRRKTDKLLKVGILELALLRTNRVSSPIKLINIANPVGAEYSLIFRTSSLTPGSILKYEVAGRSYSQTIPDEKKLPYTFLIQGTNGEYTAVLDFAYVTRSAPDFLMVRIKPT